MTKRWIVSCFSLLAGLTVVTEGAIAQVVSDGSLPTPSSVTNSGLSYTVEGGSEAGSNLFHSFSQFSIPTNGSVLFDNAASVQNIFSRVTGGVVSDIDGAIKTQNPANLFLLNPSGIVFGSSASLDIGGSFIGTTAESVQFKENVVFSTIDNGIAPLLSVSAPTGLQMGQQPGAITVQGAGHQITNDIPVVRNSTPTGLQVEAGQTLALIGGEVSFSGGVITPTNITVSTSGGAIPVAGGAHIELGSLSQGEVSFDLTQAAVPWNYSEDAQFSNIRLVHQSLIDASGIMPGLIQLRGRNVNLTDGSILLLENFGSQTSKGIAVHATETLNLTGNTLDGSIGSLILLGNLGSGETGDLIVTAAQLLLQDGAKLRNQTFTPVDGGDVLVNVQDSTVVEGVAPANPLNASNIGTVTAGSTGRAGNVELSSGSLTILDSGVVASVTQGDGDAGQVEVTARDIIEAAGNDPITLAPSGIGSFTIGAGNASEVTVNTPVLLLRESGFVSSNTLSTGAAGNVEVNASEFIEIRGRAANSVTPSRIASAAETLDLATQVAFSLAAIPSGNSGSLEINTPSLRIIEGASVTARNDGPGTAGSVRIDADSLFLDEQGSVSALAQSGEGGNIFLDSNVLLMRGGSSINATAGGTGNGGNINIASPVMVGLENSDIVANASQGDGGRISIETQGLFGLEFRDQLTLENDITASSEFGVDGTVEVNDFSLDPNAGLIELSDTFSDSDNQVAQGCDGDSRSTFIATGRGGLPPDPTARLESSRIWIDFREISSLSSRSVDVPTYSDSETTHILEANSWQIGTDGQIKLAASSDRWLPFPRSHAACTSPG